MWPKVVICSIALAAFVQLLPLKGLLAWVLLLPLLAGLLILLLPKHSVSAHRVLALTATVATLLLSLRLWAGFEAWAVEPFQQIVGLTAEWSGLVWIRLEFGLDGLNLWMVLLTALLMPLAVLCSWMTQQAHSQAFMALLLVLETTLLAAFTCLDILGFYVLYESALLPMFLLIGLGGSRPRKVRAAYLLVLYTLIGSLAMLPCILLMMSQAGTTSLELLLHEEWQPARQLVLWWGLFLAFAVKVPMMPVHLWLPEAHVEASTAGSVLLAGVLLKLGTYGFLRFLLPMFPDACVHYGPFVITLSLLGIVYASLTTLRQVDLKKIVAYSSVAHMNVVVLAVFALSDLGAQGAAFLMLAHGVASPAMFLGVGTLYDRTHTKALKYLGGAATAMPLWSMMFFLFSLANMALPLTPNFIAEFLCLCSIFAHNGWALFGACLGVILSAVYTLWAYARVVHGMPKPQFFKALADLNRRETWTFIPLLLILIWWGIKPTMVLDQLSTGLWYWNQVNFSNVGIDPWVLEVNQSLALSNHKVYFYSFLLL